jgi:hypothetical protein
VVTFTDKSTRLTGNVQADSGVDLARSMVVVFPVEAAAWVDYGRTSRRVTGVAVTTSGTFSMPTPPEGDYYLLALPADRTDDWQNPEVLKTLVPLAERLKIAAEAPPAQTLRLRRIP